MTYWQETETEGEDALTVVECPHCKANSAHPESIATLERVTAYAFVQGIDAEGIVQHTGKHEVDWGDNDSATLLERNTGYTRFLCMGCGKEFTLKGV